MPLETSTLVEKSVVWPIVSGADSFGRQRIGPSDEIDSRWEFGTRLIADPQGNKVQVIATVDVDREIAVGTIIFRGKKTDLPSPLKNLYQVITYSEVQDIKGIEIQRSVTLNKYNGTLPTSV